MSSELIAILAVGVGLAVFTWQIVRRLEERPSTKLDQLGVRLDQLCGHT